MIENNKKIIELEVKIQKLRKGVEFSKLPKSVLSKDEKALRETLDSIIR